MHELITDIDEKELSMFKFIESFMEQSALILNEESLEQLND